VVWARPFIAQNWLAAQYHSKIKPPQFLGIGDVLGLGIPRDLSRELHPKSRHVEQRDRPNAALAAQNPIPERLDGPA